MTGYQINRLLIQNILNFYILHIKNNINRKNILIYIWYYFPNYQKVILKNIIILDKIKQYIINTNNIEYKIKILLRIKQQLQSPILYNIMFKDICNKKIKYLINKEKFNQKPLEEQNKIKEIIRFKMREKYRLMTNEEKKLYNLKKRKIYIKNIGLDKYIQKIRNQYNKWYHNLSPEKLQNISLKRKLRYQSLPQEKKEIYKKNKMNKYNNLNKEEKQKLLLKYREIKKNKINSMNEIDKQNYINNLRRKKIEYFRNLPKTRKTYYYKLKTLTRQLKRNAINYDDFCKLKNDLYNKYILV